MGVSDNAPRAGPVVPQPRSSGTATGGTPPTVEMESPPRRSGAGSTGHHGPIPMEEEDHPREEGGRQRRDSKRKRESTEMGEVEGRLTEVILNGDAGNGPTPNFFVSRNEAQWNTTPQPTARATGGGTLLQGTLVTRQNQGQLTPPVRDPATHRANTGRQHTPDMGATRNEVAHSTAPPPTGGARGPGYNALGQHQPDLGARGNEGARQIQNRAAQSMMAPLAENLPRAHGAPPNYTIPRTNHQGNFQQQARGQEEWQEPPQGNAWNNDHQVPQAARARQEGHGWEDQHQPQQDGQGDGGNGRRVEEGERNPPGNNEVVLNNMMAEILEQQRQERETQESYDVTMDFSGTEVCRSIRGSCPRGTLCWFGHFDRLEGLRIAVRTNSIR